MQTIESDATANATIRAGSKTILEIMRSTLGPLGSLKLLTSKTNVLTNDGATILKNLLIDSPTAQLLIQSSIAQDKDEGDGTTSVAVLAALLIEHAPNIHRMSLIRGYSLALEICLKKLEELVVEGDLGCDMARTTLCSKVVASHIDLFTDICVKGSEKEVLNIVHAPGSLDHSFFIDGYIIDKDIDVNIKNPRILVANTSLDYDKIKIFGARIEVTSISELANIESTERERMRKKIDSICLHNNENICDIFVNRQLIYDLPKSLFSERGVTVIEHADFKGMEDLSKVTNSRVISVFDEKESAIGTCSSVETINIYGKRMVKFASENSGTIIICGSSKEILDEADRAIHDALCVLREKKYVCGGGSVETALAVELTKVGLKLAGAEGEAVLGFARALMEIPTIIAENSGMDGEKMKGIIRAEHEAGNCYAGIDVGNSVSSMKDKRVIESYRVKRRVIMAACEAAQMILKCDGFVKCEPIRRSRC